MKRFELFLFVFIFCSIPFRSALGWTATLIVSDEEQPIAVGAEIYSYELNEPKYRCMKAIYIYMGIESNQIKIKKRIRERGEWREEFLLLSLPKKQAFWSPPPKKQTLLKTEEDTLVITVVDDFGRITVKRLK